MKIMFDKDIKVMALEAHSSHFSQPLDKNPFSSFKMEFNNQVKKFNNFFQCLTLPEQIYDS